MTGEPLEKPMGWHLRHAGACTAALSSAIFLLWLRSRSEVSMADHSCRTGQAVNATEAIPSRTPGLATSKMPRTAASSLHHVGQAPRKLQHADSHRPRPSNRRSCGVLGGLRSSKTFWLFRATLA